MLHVFRRGQPQDVARAGRSVVAEFLIVHKKCFEMLQHGCIEIAEVRDEVQQRPPCRCDEAVVPIGLVVGLSGAFQKATGKGRLLDKDQGSPSSASVEGMKPKSKGNIMPWVKIFESLNIRVFGSYLNLFLEPFGVSTTTSTTLGVGLEFMSTDASLFMPFLRHFLIGTAQLSGSCRNRVNYRLCQPGSAGLSLSAVC
jgi:hypothetical protein